MNLKSRKGITGADIASAITIIVLTVGIVTGIYVNAINKSKDNIRYANAVRIATNIIENIQKNTYETLVSTCSSTGEKKLVGDGTKVFDTKIPKGFSVTIKAVKPASVAYDIARDVTVSVKYKASMTYKTVTLNTLKEKELMDISNSPDISLVPGYNTAGNYFYPVKNTGTNTYIITTTDDIEWYNYDNGSAASSATATYALVYKTTDVLKVGDTKTITSGIYAWIPRYVEIKANTSRGLGNLQFLYGTSELPITLNEYTIDSSKLFSYGVKNMSTIYKTDQFQYYPDSFKKDDGRSGIWYDISKPEATAEDIVAKKACQGLARRISPTNFTAP